MQILSLSGEETLPHLTLLLQIAFGLVTKLAGLQDPGQLPVCTSGILPFLCVT